MFTQPCFIRKNTPELRKKLEELGYKKGVSPLPVGREDIYDRDLHLFENKYHFRTYTCYGVKNNIDCGTNEELFLALAALRDDTPINSYYWFNDNLFKCEGLEIDRVLKNNTANYLLKCRRVDNPMIISCFKERNTIKATVEEIIEHFKE